MNEIIKTGLLFIMMIFFIIIAYFPICFVKRYGNDETYDKLFWLIEGSSIYIVVITVLLLENG